MRETGFNPWFVKIPWRRKWQPTPVLLPGESHGQRSLVGYSPWGCKELDMTERLHTHTHTHTHTLIYELKRWVKLQGPVSKTHKYSDLNAMPRREGHCCSNFLTRTLRSKDTRHQSGWREPSLQSSASTGLRLGSPVLGPTAHVQSQSPAPSGRLSRARSTKPGPSQAAARDAGGVQGASWRPGSSFRHPCPAEWPRRRSGHRLLRPFPKWRGHCFPCGFVSSSVRLSLRQLQ